MTWFSIGDFEPRFQSEQEALTRAAALYKENPDEAAHIDVYQCWDTGEIRIATVRHGVLRRIPIPLRDVYERDIMVKAIMGRYLDHKQGYEEALWSCIITAVAERNALEERARI